VKRLLRLIPQFRELENSAQNAENEAANLREALSEANRQNLMLQDRLDSALADKARSWDSMQTAINNERFAYQSGLNVAHGLLGWGATYPGAHELPAAKVPKPLMTEGIGQRMTPSQAVRKQAETNLREMFTAANHE
jgi:hypothetical protein